MSRRPCPPLAEEIRLAPPSTQTTTPVRRDATIESIADRRNQVSHHRRRLEKLKQAIGPKSRVFIVWDDHEGNVEAEIAGR